VLPQSLVQYTLSCSPFFAAGDKIHVDTLLHALNDMAIVPERKVNAALRLPISGAYKIKGVGDVLAGRVEQGEVKPGDEVIFLPTHTQANPCVGKVFTVEMHHKRVDKAGPGDNVGMNIKGLDKGNMPRTGESAPGPLLEHAWRCVPSLGIRQCLHSKTSWQSSVVQQSV